MQKVPRRKDRTIDDRKEIEALLDRMPVGRLGLTTDEGPYVLSVNYLPTEGCIYFHSAREGKKMDALRDNPRVCFLVEDVGSQVQWKVGCGFSQIYESVICFGNSELVENEEEKRLILDQLTKRFLPSEVSLQPFDPKKVKNTAVVKIKVDWMTAKANRLTPDKKIIQNRFLNQPE